MFDGLKPTTITTGDFALTVIEAERVGGTIKIQVPEAPTRANLVQTSFCMEGGFYISRNGLESGEYLPGTFSEDRPGPPVPCELIYTAKAANSKYCCVTSRGYKPYDRKRFNITPEETRTVRVGNTFALLEGTVKVAGEIIHAPFLIVARSKNVSVEGVGDCKGMLLTPR